MKKAVFSALAVALLTACESNVPQFDDQVVMRFYVQGDFDIATTPFTRSMVVDDKTLTDVWVFDYMDGALVQQLHQVSTDDDFGAPSLNLKVGSHHLYFVASMGTTPVVDTDAGTIIFSNVKDTFWKDLILEVAAISSSTQPVMLERVITKLRLTITDALPEGLATLNITPSVWYYGLNYQTGEPVASVDNGTITINVPSGNIGLSNVSANIYGFSNSTEWNISVNFSAKHSNGGELGYVIIADVPFKRNRSTEISGPLFGTNGTLSMSLNTTWDDANTSTW